MSQENERKRENKRGQDSAGGGRLFTTAMRGLLHQGGRSNTESRREHLTERLDASSATNILKRNTDKQHPSDKKSDLNINKNIPKSSKNECNVQDQSEGASNSSRNRSLSCEAVRARHARNLPEAKYSELKPNHEESGANECFSNSFSKTSTSKGISKHDTYLNETAFKHDYRVKRSNSFRDGGLRDSSPAFSKSVDTSTTNKSLVPHKIYNYGSSCRQSKSSQRLQETDQKSYRHKRHESQDDYGQHALHSDYRSENDGEELDTKLILNEGVKIPERYVSDCVNTLTITIPNPQQIKGADSFNAKNELNSKFCDQTSGKAVIIPTPKTKSNNCNVLYNNRSTCSSDIGDEEALSIVDEKNSKENTSAVQSKNSYSKFDNHPKSKLSCKFSNTSAIQSKNSYSKFDNHPKSKLSCKFSDYTSKKSMAVYTPENNTSNHDVLDKNRNKLLSDSSDGEALSMVDEKSSKGDTSAIHSKICHSKFDVYPKSKSNSKFSDHTSKNSVIRHTSENNSTNLDVLQKNGNDTGDGKDISCVDVKNTKENTSAIHSKINHSQSGESDEKVFNIDFIVLPVGDSVSECKVIQGTIRNVINESGDFSDLGDKKMLSEEKKEVCSTNEAKRCPKILPEHYEAVTNYILEIEKERKVDCQIAGKVIYDLTRFFGYYFPGTNVDYYGSYRSGLAITTSNINISLKSDVPLRNSFWSEVHKGFSKELAANPKYHVLPYEDKASVKATKILFIEPYTGVECEMAYLGRAEKNICSMADLLRTLSMFDVRVKSLFIAARIWAEVCAIDEVEDGKLPAIAFPLLVTYFLQRYQEPVLPVLKMEEFHIMQKKLRAWPKTTASVGELWFEFLRFYAVIFNWDENIVSITSLETVSKSSKCVGKVWIYIEDPFSGENIAKSVTNLDTANFIRACFDASYNHRPSLCESSSGSVKDSKKWTYSFDSCDIYQYAPLECEDCAVFETGTCQACAKKEYVPIATPLPDLPDDSLLLKTADKVLHDVYNEYILSEIAIKGRKAFVEDLEKYIQQRFKGAKLALFGSSVNGFGFNKSDLDINLTFSTNEAKKWSERSLILKQVMRHLRKNDNYKDVFFLPAKIPIVKFCYIRKGWCGDISFGNSLAVNNSELLHAYSTVDERCRILGCALKLITKKTGLASTADKALSSYSYIIMVIYYLQQVKPPVLPVLQDYKLCKDNLEVPNEIVETWNTWFYKGDKETYAVALTKQSGQPKNTKTAAQLWIGLLDFYVNFNYDHVISIRQREILPVEEKQRTFHSFNIEDPFILSKNLGSVLSSGKHKELQVVLGNARQLFGNEKKFPKNMENYKNYFFSPSHLTGRVQKERECSICGEFDHETSRCQRVQRRKFQFRNYQTFNTYTKNFKL